MGLVKTDCDSTGANFAHFVADGASQHLEHGVRGMRWIVSEQRRADQWAGKRTAEWELRSSFAASCGTLHTWASMPFTPTPQLHLL